MFQYTKFHIIYAWQLQFTVLTLELSTVNFQLAVKRTLEGRPHAARLCGVQGRRSWQQEEE